MKKHRSVRLNRLAIVCCALGSGACGDDGGHSGTSTVTGTVTSDNGTITVTSTSTAVTGTVDTSTMTATTGVGGTGTGTGTTGEVDTCSITSLALFSRSDTDAAWDDNDFSDVVLESGCPTVINVTWPHEEDWEDADPSESNSEETHFTLDSYAFGGDLTGKQLNLTIELSDDARGPNATAGAYLVSLVSVSTYQYEAEDPGAGGTCGEGAGGTSGTGTDTGTGTGGDLGTGTGTTTGTMGSSDTGGAGGTCPDAAGGVGGMGGVGGTTDTGTDGTLNAGGEAGAGVDPILTTGYTEAETPRESRLVLRYIDDRATLVFPLPDKTDEVDSYDPATAIKINVRIYNMSYEDMMEEGMGGAGGLGGTGGDGGVGGMTATGMTGTGMTGTGMTATGMTGTGMTGTGMTGTGMTATGTTGTEMTGTGTAGMGGASSTSGDSSTDGSTAEPIFDYVTSQFTITHLSVTDRGQRP